MINKIYLGYTFDQKNDHRWRSFELIKTETKTDLTGHFVAIV